MTNLTSPGPPGGGRKPETWQEMAARLGVEVNRDSSFVEMEFKRSGQFCYVVDGVVNIDTNIFPLDPIEARDLSDCLQVAARYLEEVKGD